MKYILFLLGSGAGHMVLNRKMHWHSWESFCQPKAMGGMWFRDLKVFIQALLAKQMWRLHCFPESLLHSVLQARYFKHSSVLEAFRGHDPSYLWRSIWGAKSLQLDGLTWRGGNGINVNVWMDDWLPGSSIPPVPMNGQTVDPDMRVIDLLDAECGEWHVQKVCSLFPAEVSNKILSFPLSLSLPPDMKYCWPTKCG